MLNAEELHLLSLRLVLSKRVSSNCLVLPSPYFLCPSLTSIYLILLPNECYYLTPLVCRWCLTHGEAKYPIQCDSEDLVAEFSWDSQI